MEVNQWVYNAGTEVYVHAGRPVYCIHAVRYTVLVCMRVKGCVYT